MLHVEKDSIDMIIDFDRNPALSIDQKLQSLMESVQLALNELYGKATELTKKIGSLSSSDVGAVPLTRKVNNKALSSDIALTASDIGLDYITLVNAQSYSTTTANTWQYTGHSFTVPSGHVYVVRLYTQYSAGKPIGLGIHSAASMSGAITAPLYNTENANGVQGYTMLLPAGTYYIWSKRAGTGSNTYTATALDLSIA